MMQADGQWQGRSIVSAQWIRRMRTPCAIAPFYGLLTWLNDGPKQVYPAASRSSSFMIGAGGQVTWMDPERDLVVASRWVTPEDTNGLFARIAGMLA
jgi:CubicO group peptidase (beta-lactamase class C family)